MAWLSAERAAWSGLMMHAAPVVVLMCGLPGFGKTTRELAYLPVDRATLKHRLAVRNRENGANAVTVDDSLFDRYATCFEVPDGEGESAIS
ncbi:hypothetical protein ACPA54_07485 [Uniformispora flossi]|uniref:hypothetical protein n=1 Tax=Uniformispora flossi TaxID=3390723 RepID=UPI003C2D600F